MVDFHEHVIKPVEESEAYIAEKGGLPEIERAAEDLRAAIDRTRGEIAAATFAERFKPVMSVMARNTGVMDDLSTLHRAAAEAGGEQGLKRAQLETDLQHAEQELFKLIDRLVRIRADLVISQEEF